MAARSAGVAPLGEFGCGESEQFVGLDETARPQVYREVVVRYRFGYRGTEDCCAVAHLQRAGADLEFMNARAVRTEDFLRRDRAAVEVEHQRLGQLDARLSGHGDLELEGGRPGDRDFQLRRDVTLHSTVSRTRRIFPVLMPQPASSGQCGGRITFRVLIGRG